MTLEVSDGTWRYIGENGIVAIGVMLSHPGVWMIGLMGELPEGFVEWHNERMMPLSLVPLASFHILITLVFGDELALEWRMRWT